MEKEFVIIKQKTLQKLLDNFYEVCCLADEMDVYEFEEGDQSMQKMKKWADKTFGSNRKIEKDSY
jgi:hypothetical protein